MQPLDPAQQRARHPRVEYRRRHPHLDKGRAITLDCHQLASAHRKGIRCMSQSGVRRNDRAAPIHPHPQPAARRRLQAARQPRVTLGVA